MKINDCVVSELSNTQLASSSGGSPPPLCIPQAANPGKSLEKSNSHKLFDTRLVVRCWRLFVWFLRRAILDGVVLGGQFSAAEVGCLV